MNTFRNGSWPPLFLTPVDPVSIARGDGDVAAIFAEAFGSIGKDGIAGLAGAPLELRAWQKKLLEHLYARVNSREYFEHDEKAFQAYINGQDYKDLIASL